MNDKPKKTQAPLDEVSRLLRLATIFRRHLSYPDADFTLDHAGATKVVEELVEIARMCGATPDELHPFDQSPPAVPALVPDYAKKAWLTPCPKCKAKVGQPCLQGPMQPMVPGLFHNERWDASRVPEGHDPLSPPEDDHA